MASVHTRRYKQLIRRLREARVEAGLTQDQVAKAFRMPQSWVSKCESGERRVDAVELEKFGKLYGKPITFFLPEGDEE
jgi:transcriptional regulator with XRE-family HTH domain